MGRRRRSAVFGLAAAFCVLTVTVSAVVADGRPGIEAQLNDGGAWLLNRSQSSVGHVNRAVREISSVVGPFSGAYEVSQAASVVVVNNRGAGQAVLIDTGLSKPGAAVAIPDSVDVHAVADAVVLADPASGTAWRYGRAEFASLETIEGQSPHLESGSGGPVAVGLDGMVATADTEQGSIRLLMPDGETQVIDVDVVRDAQVPALTLVGSKAVALVDGDRLVVAEGNDVLVHSLSDKLAVLQEPSGPGRSVTGVTGDGVVVEVNLDSGEEEAAAVSGARPLAPIVHKGCNWLITYEPSPAFHYCDHSYDLPSSATEITLSLVNDWVWVNDVNQGSIWFVREDDLEVEQLSDWSAALELNEETEDTDGGGGPEELVEAATADEISDEVDELDEDDRNEPPDARDDDARGRQGRPILVPVVANDSDPDNDPLAVESLTGVDASGFAANGARVEIEPGGTSIQVVPPADFVGSISFGYVIHDGRQGRDEAEVTIEVLAPDAPGNQPPVTKDDSATVRAGRSVSLNVLSNDLDPEGDSLLLLGVEVEGGQVSFAPDGEISFAPDVTSPDGTITIEYTVADEFGQESTAIAQIFVRQSNSNQAPQARNDYGATAVGRPALLNVLDNDADPDGDPLSAQSLRSLDGIATDAQLTADGFFIFTPEASGVYRFAYTVNDGPEIDEAQIRVDVFEPVENQRPVAVLDEVALAVGESRLVRVLLNDGDPDGDVLGVVDWVGAEGLDIQEAPGQGFFVRPLDSAEDVTLFRYWISDGITEPVMGQVEVSALRRPPVDYRPTAVADSFDVRPGQTSSLAILRNDFDPEGSVLTIAEPIPQLTEGSLRVSDDGQQLLLKVNDEEQFGFQFSYDIEDPAGNRASAVVNIRLIRNQPNRSPVAGPDLATTPAAAPVTIPVLANDFDPDSDPIRVESVASQPTNGSVELQPDGSIIYQPNEGFSGTDTFSYTLVDGFVDPDASVGIAAVENAGGSDDTEPSASSSDSGSPGRSLGRVYVGVMSDGAVNRAPIAVDDSSIARVEIDGEAAVLAVLGNDSDPDFDPIQITGVSPPAVGSVDVVGSGVALRYTPPADGDARTVAFNYTIADGRGGEASAQVTVELLAAVEPEPPVAVDDRIGPVRAGSVVDFDPRVNDRDPDGDATQLAVVVNDPNIQVLPTGGLAITAPAVTGEFTYRVRDAQDLSSDPAVITVLVQPNEPPVVETITVETEFNTPIEIDLHDAVSDSDEDALVLALGSNFSGGSVQVAAPPADNFLRALFTPDQDFEGTATFDYTVDDLMGHVVAGSVVIDVLPPENRPPVLSPIQIAGEAGIDVPIRLSTAVADPDPDGAASHVFSVSGLSAGDMTLSGPGGGDEVVLSSPVDAGEATVTFDYTVADDEFIETNTVTVEIRPASFAPPGTQDDEVQILQGEVTPAIAVLENDSDQSPAGLQGDGLIVTAVGVTPAGRVDLNGNLVTFTPLPDFFGQAQFTYTVQDGRRSSEGEAVGNVTVNVIGRPDTPAPPVVEQLGDGYVVLSWSPPAGAQGRGAVTGYELQYTSGNGNGNQVFANPTTSFRWDGLTNGVEHCFAVAAINEAGQGDFSPSPGTAECGTPDRVPEPIPVAPTVEFGNGDLTISWPEAVSGGSPVKNYQVRIGGGQSGLSAELGTALTYTWPNLNNGTDYTFQVRSQNSALDNDGWSDWSPISTPEHPLTAPDAPGRPEAVRGNQQVQITWTQPGDGGDTITEYQIRSSIASTWVSVTPQGVSNSYTWESIPNGTAVSFEVRAINRDPTSTTPGNISQSSLPVTTCTVPDAPAPPTIVDEGDGVVDLSWNAPPDQGCAIIDYVVTASNGRSETVPASSRTYRFGSNVPLTNGTTYTFTVAARNEVVITDGQPAVASSASASASPFGLPFAPTNLTATNVDVREVRLSWGAAVGNGRPVSDYQISVNDGAWTSVGVNTTITRDEGSDGAGYSYRVRAANERGPGAVSNTASITTWDLPGTPSVSVSSGGQTSINSSWSTPTTGGTGLTSHEARISTSSSCGGGTLRANAGSPESWGGLSHSTRYHVCVRYRNAVGWGPWGSGNAQTDAPPQPTLNVWWGAQRTNLPGSYYVYVSGTNWPAGARIEIQCKSTNGTVFADTSINYPEVYLDRFADGNGNFSITPANPGICYSAWATIVRVWAPDAGVDLQRTLSAP